MVKKESGRRCGDEGGVFGGEFVRFSVQNRNSWTEVPYVGNMVSLRGVLMLGGG